MESEGVSLPLIHDHPMMPWNDLRKGDCCRQYQPLSDGYYCKICDFFVHKKCGDEISEFIDHPSHPEHTLWRRCKPAELKHPTEVNHSYHSLHPLKLLTGEPPDYSDRKCRLCGGKIDKELFYHCLLNNPLTCELLSLVLYGCLYDVYDIHTVVSSSMTESR
ncbi:hypothetical protein HA466_0025810 [Hirschfeldia incana]|nr:hypothetical protein HA466_0025810 [Hirschfeldia incana]